MLKLLDTISLFAIPSMLLLIPIIGWLRGVKVYEAFTEGAKEGFTTAVTIIPYMVAMLVAIGVFRASGAMDFIIRVLSPVTSLIGMPSEVLPMALMRPLSGGGAEGILGDLLSTYGPDSLIGRMGSIMMGSTETTFYILMIYFGAVSVKNTRHALPAGLIADAAGLLGAVFIAKFLFG